MVMAHAVFLCLIGVFFVVGSYVMYMVYMDGVKEDEKKTNTIQ